MRSEEARSKPDPYATGQKERGTLVRCWVARASVAIQRAQFWLVRQMRSQAQGGSRHGQPNEWGCPEKDDVDARHARGPPRG